LFQAARHLGIASRIPAASDKSHGMASSRKIGEEGDWRRMWKAERHEDGRCCSRDSYRVGLGVAAFYYLTPAGDLPSFIPGFAPGSTKPHLKHALVALIVGLAALVFAWFAGRAR
jgi:hypothetical protein